ncbi:HD domain-containing phosphohydrolase [Azotosporobacter soli]|uniref:response regulator n=1 Tax=Azotosporobacter soli TaxID=3055040 RepID=UPI0031FE8659
MAAKKILLIDESHLMRLQVRLLLEREGFQVAELDSVQDYFANLWRYAELDLLLLDVDSGERGGLAALRGMQEKPGEVWPAVFILSGNADRETIRTALCYGAKDYILKPFVSEDFLRKIAYFFHAGAGTSFKEKYDALVEEFRLNSEAILEEGEGAFPKEKIDALAEECFALVKGDVRLILFNHDYGVAGYTFRHSVNVALLSALIGQWMGLGDEKLRKLTVAGLLHDLGKMAIPPAILNKRGELTPDEREIVCNHPRKCLEILALQGYERELLFGILQHHERVDGSGYPEKLPGRAISLFARIIAVADVYDAMMSNRVYHHGVTPFVVIEQLVKDMAGKLDPLVCSVLLKNSKEQMVGQRVILADGRKAVIEEFEEGGFAEPVLQLPDGQRIRFNESSPVVRLKG